jgi:hypothetical protein
MRDALDREHREMLLLVVVAGVIAERSFERRLAGRDVAFEHDLGGCRHLEIAAQAFHEFGLRATQQAGELVFRELNPARA